MRALIWCLFLAACNAETGGAAGGGSDPGATNPKAAEDGGIGLTGDGAAPPRDSRPADAARESAPGDAALPTSGNPYVYACNGAIHVFQLDMTSGVLTRRHQGTGSGVVLAMDAQGTYLYGMQNSSVSAYAIDRTNGSLKAVNSADTGGGGASWVSVHPGGKWVLVSHYTSNNVSVLPVRPGGGLDRLADQRQDGAKAHDIVSDAAGRFVFVPYLGSDYVEQYSFDATTGKLAPGSPATSASISNGPRQIAFHPTQKFAYVISEGGGTITSLKYDAAAGMLSDPQTIANVPAGFSANGSVVVAPSGKFVYSSNRRHKSLQTFSVNESTGRLTLVGYEMAGGLLETPDDFVIDPTGKFLIASIYESTGYLLVFQIGADGKPTMKSKTDLPGASTALVAPF